MNNPEVEKLKPCPCGVIPNELHIAGETRAKWAYVSGQCCNEWNVEFKNGYEAIGSTKSLELAMEAWNDTPRVSSEDSLNDAAASLGIVSEGQELTAPALKAWAKRTNNEQSKIAAMQGELAGIRDELESACELNSMLDKELAKGEKKIDRIRAELKDKLDEWGDGPRGEQFGDGICQALITAIEIIDRINER